MPCSGEQCGPTSEAGHNADRAGSRQAWIANEREQLSQNYERFLHSEPADRERLRELHAALEAAPERDELRQGMQSYHDWLNELPASQHITLAALPAEDRLKRSRGDPRLPEASASHVSVPQDLEAVSRLGPETGMNFNGSGANPSEIARRTRVTAEDLAELRLRSRSRTEASAGRSTHGRKEQRPLW